MGLFDIFWKRNDGQKATPPAKPSLPLLCYDIANYGVPEYAFNDCDTLIKVFTDAAMPAGPFFYRLACEVRKTEPIYEDAERFRAHSGKLDDAHDYFVLEYPSPPPVDLSGVDLSRIPREQIPVLAPYFSAVVRHRQTGAVNCYILEQAIEGGGTTLRSVAADVRYNFGPGPEPRLDAFLAVLRSRG